MKANFKRLTVGDNRCRGRELHLAERSPIRVGSHIVMHAVAGLSEANRIPETNWWLNPKFILECSQWRVGVVGPVTPSATSQAWLLAGLFLSIFFEK